MRTFSPYWDQYMLLVQKDGDGGDSAQRMGMYFYAKHLKSKSNDERKSLATHFHHSLSKLHDGKGNFRRHPDPTMWYSDWNRMSRDNMTPLVIAMGEFGFYHILKLSMFKLILRCFFMTNTRQRNVWKDESEHKKKSPRYRSWDYSFKCPDFAITHVPLYIRAFRAKLLWPLLFLFDIDLLLGAVIKSYFAKYNSKVCNGDDLNFALELINANRIMPTFTAKLAKTIYKCRPHQKTLPVKKPETFLVYDYETNSGPQSALQYYFAKNNFADPPLDLLYKPIIEAL